MEKLKTISELSNDELEHCAYVATDSFLMMDALFDDDEDIEDEKQKIIQQAKELSDEMKKRGILVSEGKK
jgi:hypothetical protein